MINSTFFSGHRDGCQRSCEEIVSRSEEEKEIQDWSKDWEKVFSVSSLDPPVNRSTMPKGIFSRQIRLLTWNHPKIGEQKLRSRADMNEEIFEDTLTRRESSMISHTVLLNFCPTTVNGIEENLKMNSRLVHLRRRR
jgi:hypothetical protein